MKNTAYLQWVINGMGEPLFNFANTKDGQRTIQLARNFIPVREFQIKELLVNYTTNYAVQLAIDVIGLPDTEESITEFFCSEDYGVIYKEVFKTVDDNYTDLMNCLTEKDKRRLHALFE